MTDKTKAQEALKILKKEKELIVATIKKAINGMLAEEDFQGEKLVKMWNAQLNRLCESIALLEQGKEGG